MLLNTDNGQPYQIKTIQAKKKLASCPELGSAQHQLVFISVNIINKKKLNKFFDPSTPSMRKGRDGGKKKREKGGKKEKMDENSGHYVIASSRPPERRPLERRTLAPKS